MTKLSKALLTGILILCTITSVYADIAKVFCSKSDGNDWYWLTNSQNIRIRLPGEWIETTLPDGSSSRYFYIIEEFYRLVRDKCQQGYFPQPAESSLDDWYLFKVHTFNGEEYFAPGSLGPIRTERLIEPTTARGFSDIRLKQDIQPLQDSLEKINHVNGYRYQWRPDSIQSHLTGQTEYGVIAQEIQLEFPELVKPDDKGYLRVDYQGLVPVLLESIKELKERIEVLEIKH
ncbi:tail fiber domain-containing protein [Spartinivicinus poritis]|uniref:Tail fiber domain-containing protein n=1 Tax=Spartinivicinus poritis TaxID=2994640 RepID=A0ABT5UJ81_9GAMM|nr:tail fiber domain-containing protein [Spartinivicinus sp. A2-2]MDE1465104.1 tail fiber domain-containing protein [Spartinivicinus sp. A2-2]